MGIGSYFLKVRGLTDAYGEPRVPSVSYIPKEEGFPVYLIMPSKVKRSGLEEELESGRIMQ